ncbi:MAG: hypothetical protein RR630_01250 [Coprobacillus sp.]
MKKILNKIITSLLVMTMIFTLSYVKTGAQTEVKYEYNWTTETTDLAYNDKNKFIMEVVITIPKDAKDKVVIDFGQVREQYMILRKQNGAASNMYSMPGDAYPMRIKIVNESDSAYEYKNNSLVVETGDEGVELGKLPETKALIELLDTDNSKKLSIEEICELYNQLAAKGFKNDGTALERYLINWANTEYKIEVTSMKELVEKYPKYAGAVLGGNTIDFDNPVDSLIEFKLTIDEANAYCDKSEFFNNYATMGSKVSGTKPVKYNFQISFPEKELARLSTALFYQDYISIGYGIGINNADKETSVAAKIFTPSSKKLNYRINDYVMKRTAYTDGNEFFVQLIDEDSLKGKTCVFNYTLALDGSIGNAYAGQAFSYNNRITLEKVITSGDVTVSKTLDLNGFKNNDQPTFIFKLTDSKGVVHYKTMSFKEGESSQSAKFENIPLGKYVVEEIDTIRYEQTGDIPHTGTLTRENNSKTALITNKKVKNTDFSDTNVVVNSFKKTDNGIEISQNNQGTQE